MSASDAPDLTLSRIPPDWVAAYIGLPWRERGRPRAGWRAARADEEVAGVDCWGLVRLVLAERFGIDVPSYDGAYDPADRAELGALVRGERLSWTAVAEARAGDVVLLRIGGEPCHCGVLVARALMLHVERGTCAALERLDGIRWGKRVAGIYRWAEGV